MLIEAFVIKSLCGNRQMKKAEQIERLQEMRRLYEVEKMNLREIADRFGVTWQAIHQKLAKAGVPMRQKSPVRRLIDRETLVQIYIDEKLTIGETAKRLKIDVMRVSEELQRHGIEKRSRGYFKRKQPELYQLNVGEKTVVKRPPVKSPYRSLYTKAHKIGIRISIRSVDKETFQITRVN